MIVLGWSIGITLAAFLLHVILWKRSLPKRQTRSLLGVFFGVLVLSLGISALGGYLGWNLPVATPVALSQYVQIAIFVIACALGYTIIYSAIEVDSPTLVMVTRIAEIGKTGLTKQELRASLSDQVLIEPRLADLVRDKMLVKEGDAYRITPKGKTFVAIFIKFRRVFLNVGRGG